MESCHFVQNCKRTRICLVLKIFNEGAETTYSVRVFHRFTGEVMPSLSCSHEFLLEFQAVSPGYRIVVQLKWHSVNFIDSMEICVCFNHVSSCSSIVEAWELKHPEPVTIFEVVQFWD